MDLKIYPNVPMADGLDEQWITGDQFTVFVSIDADAGFVRHLSTRLPAGVVFEIGQSINPSGRSYPCFHVLREDKAGNVLWRRYISKATGDWVVDDE